MKIYPNKLPKLRNNSDYMIGLDLGTASVGWAAIDKSGDLCQFKGKPTWGSRLFASADPASDARVFRGQRRRYIRRRWRINFLREIFETEITKVDKNFYYRLDNAFRVDAERNFSHPLFNESDTKEINYYKKFPTIYHLRKYLVSNKEKSDIRLVYLALHNIVKYRGNFLRQGEHLKSENSDINKEVENFVLKYSDYVIENYDIGIKIDTQLLIDILTSDKCLINNNEYICKTNNDKSKVLQNLICPAKDLKAFALNISKAIVGLVADYSKIFHIEDGVKFSFKDDEKVSEFNCPDIYVELYESIKNLYSAVALQGILKSAPGKSISFCKVNDYDLYGNQLKKLKKLFKKYSPEKYNEFFRGSFFDGTSVYDPAKAKGYTRYNLGVSKSGSGGNNKMTAEELGKEIHKYLDGTNAVKDKDYIDICTLIESNSFLIRQKTSDNGSIPYQLHLEEMEAIIDNQSEYYPFLAKNKSKLMSLVTFRIPYYVGPLSVAFAPTAKIKGKTQNRFAWATRIDSQNKERITPWNWDKIIDKNKSAQIFIERMTGTCTYLPSEDVLPRCSLLYEEFCVRNELNGSWFADHRRFNPKLIELIFDDLFKNGIVTKKKVQDLMKQEGLIGYEKIGGFQGESKYESSLSSYLFFKNKIFNIDEIPEEYFSDIEDIILWNTVYEDREILKEKLTEEFTGSTRTFSLNSKQINTICKKRFTGWGRLSRKLLTEIKEPTYETSIIEILRDGNPILGNRPAIFQEIITNEDLGIKQQIDKIASEEVNLLAINELPGSPAIRRSINQALRIVKEIESIAKNPPSAVFIEVTRDDNVNEKGKRKSTRLDKLKIALSELGKSTDNDTKSTLNELKSVENNDITEKLMLYLMQNGRCMYSGKNLDINNLSFYQVDHIVPQFLIKDDSFDNKVLVLSEENQRKSDLMLDDSVVSKMLPFWKALRKCSEDLVSEKKLRNLCNNYYSDKRMTGFINRQLVETSQINKTLRYMLEARYERENKPTRVYNIKASLSSELRNKKFGINLPKCRDANDYHHAHDAYLAAQIGRFLQFRHANVLDDPIKLSYGLKQYIKNNIKDKSALYRICNGPSFVIHSFKQTGFNLETGEIERDTWNSAQEISRIKQSIELPYCYISRMPVEDSGAFWDQTIYSPKQTKKKLDISLKEDREAFYYGGYSRGQSAYFVLINDKSNKKKPLLFMPIPINVARAIAQGSITLFSYIQNTIDSNDFSIIRDKIYKFQLIEVSGDRYYITGNKEVRNAKQIAFSLQEYETILGNENQATNELIELYNVINCKLPYLSHWLNNSITIDIHKFKKLSKEDMISIISGLCMVVNGKRNTVDTHLVGGSKYAGSLQKPLANLLQYDACFVDQSTTGMFEKKTKIEI